jgi:hypothetical protein
MLNHTDIMAEILIRLYSKNGFFQKEYYSVLNYFIFLTIFILLKISKLIYLIYDIS